MLLLFSHEKLDLPPYGWSGCYSQYYRYDRLIPAARLLAAASPLAVLPLLPTTALPGVAYPTHKREIHWLEQGYQAEQLLYALISKNVQQAGQLLAVFDYGEADALVRSRLLAAMNRPEPAYALSRRSLDKVEEPSAASPTASTYEQAQLLLAHGLHAALTGHTEEAVVAFERSYHQWPGIEPLVAWADERLRLGYTDKEVIEPIAQTLALAPGSDAFLIQMLHAIGLDRDALQHLEAASLTGHPFLAQIRFECLIRTGQLDTAAAWFQAQGEAYASRYSIDRFVWEWSQAPDDNTRLKLVCSLSAGHLEDGLDRLVALCLYTQAEALQPFLANPLALGHRLFEHGYVMRAATFYLAAMQKNTLDRAGYQRLAEILLLRGADEQAAEMLQFLLRETPEDPRLRSALALACLRQSRKLLEESMRLFPSSAFLREEADKTADAIKQLAERGAVTVWRLRERGNFHA